MERVVDSVCTHKSAFVARICRYAAYPLYMYTEINNTIQCVFILYMCEHVGLVNWCASLRNVYSITNMSTRESTQETKRGRAWAKRATCKHAWRAVHAFQVVDRPLSPWDLITARFTNLFSCFPVTFQSSNLYLHSFGQNFITRPW
jgi:hypothetical protein